MAMNSVRNDVVEAGDFKLNWGVALVMEAEGG